MEQLICKNLKLGYENITLAEDLSFSVESGDYLCIVGENGAGKSTLMRTILRLQKPLGGTIEYTDGLTASAIGYLPQQTIVQKDFPASVYEVVYLDYLRRHRRNVYRPLSFRENREKMGERKRQSACCSGQVTAVSGIFKFAYVKIPTV